MTKPRATPLCFSFAQGYRRNQQSFAGQKSQDANNSVIEPYSYKELKIVGKCKSWISHIYQVTADFPQSELYGLTSQIRRAAISVVLNIAEGRRKKSNKDFFRFLVIADGSLAETKIAMELSLLLNFISSDKAEKIEMERKEIAYMLSSLIRKVQSQCPKKSLHLALFLYLFISLLPSETFAKVSVSELYPNPSSGESEWIELYNDATTSADLSGWQLKDQLSTPSVIYQFENETISPLSFQVFFLNSSKLNNSADGVVLLNPQAEIIDQMNYLNSTIELSWSKIDDSWVLTNPTINQANLLPPSPSPTPSPTAQPIDYQQITSALQISEVYYCPTSDQTEWMELYNQSDQLLEIDDWSLVDQSGNRKNFNLNINPKSLAVFEWSTGFLNNSGDFLSVIQPDGQLAFKLNLPPCQTATSLIYHDSSWQLSSNVTKNATNIFSSINQLKKEQINENLEDKKTVTGSKVTTVNEVDLKFSSIPYPPNKINLSVSHPTPSGQVLGINDTNTDHEVNKSDQLKKIWIAWMISAILFTTCSILTMINTKANNSKE